MKIPHIYLFLCVNSVAIVMAYNYRRCYPSYSICLITNTTDDIITYYNRWNSKFRLTRWEASNWCEGQSSSLAIITNDTVQSAVEEFIKDRSSELLDSDVVTNGQRFNLSNWEWVTGRKSAIYPTSSYHIDRYVYLTVSSDRSYFLSAGLSTWKKKFICSYVTRDTSCSSGFRQFGSRCYKIHNTKTTWFDARNICLKEESDLATFEDGISSLNLEWIGEYWIGVRKENWYWLNHQTNYGEIKYSNWEDNYPHSTIGDCLCLKARTGKWINCDCLRTYRYICIQGYNGSNEGRFGDSTSQLYSTPFQTLDDDFGSKLSENSAVTVESEHAAQGFLPIIGIGIVCLLILIVVIALVFINNRRRSTRQEVSYTTNAFQPASSVDDYTTLKRECLTENVTYAELDVYETIEDEKQKNSN